MIRTLNFRVRDNFRLDDAKAQPLMTPAPTSNKIDAYVWRISAVVIVGSIMSILDTTIVNVALATLGRELHSSIDQIQWVVTGLPAVARRRDPGHRLGGAPVRRQARLHHLAGPVHRRLGAVRPRVLDHRADRVPRASGRRWRHDPADRPADDGRGRRPQAHGPRDEHRRRSGDAGADPRPDDRRPDPRQRELALDLLRQRSDRTHRGRSRRSGSSPRSSPSRPRGSTSAASHCWPPGCRC